MRIIFLFLNLLKKSGKFIINLCVTVYPVPSCLYYNFYKERELAVERLYGYVTVLDIRERNP